MARIPQYGRVVQPAGPVPWSPGGPGRDMGLAVLADVSADLGRQMTANYERIQRANAIKEIGGRSAGYALAMEGLMMDVDRIGDPVERQKAWQSRAGQIERQALSWTTSDKDSQARLQAIIADEKKRFAVRWLQTENDRSIREQVAAINASKEMAVETGNRALFMEMIHLEAEHGYGTEAGRAQEVEQFDTEADLAAIRQQIDMLDQSDSDPATRIAGLDSLEVQLQDVRNKAATEKQRNKAAQLLDWTRSGAQAIRVAADKAEKEFREKTGRSVYSDMVAFDTSSGKEGKSYSIVELGELYEEGALGKEQFDALVKVKTGGNDPNPWAAFQAEVLVTEVESGQKTAENAMARIMELAPDMTVQERARFNTDIAKARSSWRGHIRSKGERAIDNTINPPNALLPIPEPVAAVAKSQYWQIVREMEEKRELLSEEKLLPLAVDLATKTMSEYRADRQGFNAKHGYTGDSKVELVATPAVNQSTPTVTTDEEYDNLPSGAEFIGPDGRIRRKP